MISHDKVRNICLIKSYGLPNVISLIPVPNLESVYIDRQVTSKKFKFTNRYDE